MFLVLEKISWGANVRFSLFADAHGYRFTCASFDTA